MKKTLPGKQSTLSTEVPSKVSPNIVLKAHRSDVHDIMH